MKYTMGPSSWWQEQIKQIDLSIDSVYLKLDIRNFISYFKTLFLASSYIPKLKIRFII